MGRDGKMDVHLGVCHDGYVVRLDVIEGPSGRRQRSDEDKARIVAESLTAGVRVADVARRHGLTRSQVYAWRRRVRAGPLALPGRLVPYPAFQSLIFVQCKPRQSTSRMPAVCDVRLKGLWAPGINVDAHGAE